MSDEELLKQAESAFMAANDLGHHPEGGMLLSNQSIAASLLVIARKSLPVDVESKKEPCNCEHCTNKDYLFKPIRNIEPGFHSVPDVTAEDILKNSPLKEES